MAYEIESKKTSKRKKHDYFVERHLIKANHRYFAELDRLCSLSKNLYNATLYAVRQEYFQTKAYLDYSKVNKSFTVSNQVDYRALPAKVAKHTQKLVDANYRAFFASLKAYNKDLAKNLAEGNKPPRPPRYLDKDGRQVVAYEKGALSFVKKGFVRLSQTQVYIKTQQDPTLINFVRVVPKGNHVIVEVGYKVTYPEFKPCNQRFASIDLGLNNLATVVSNITQPFIFNGKPLKSINQYFNKELAKENEKLDLKHKTNSTQKDNLFLVRKNKILHYMHHVSRQLVNYLVENDIRTLVIGKNQGQKQNIELGKKNNQNFVQIPFNMLIEQLTYKCRLVGIQVALQEESYTSKCSFLDNESVERHEHYQGKRIRRGLFRTGTGKLINADVNGALNILKKYLLQQETWNNQYWFNLVEMCSTFFPRKITISL